MALSAAAVSLWGKTGRVSRKPGIGPDDWHPLIGHAIDSAEVAGWLWDHFLSIAARRRFSQCLPGEAEGRRLIQWLAALHDLGKATPAFQVQSTVHADAVRAAGLTISSNARADGQPHAAYSARLLLDVLSDYGWSVEDAKWACLILGGHHGMYPGSDWHSSLNGALPTNLGDAAWARARAELVEAIADHLAVDLAAWRSLRPSLPTQLALTGAVILADWLASNDEICGYDGGWPSDYGKLAASRSGAATGILDITGQLTPLPAAGAVGASELYARRFPAIPQVRPVQAAAYELAAGATGPGLLLIEAPMGEGKTEAALTAAEVLAAMTGASGIFVGLPTQATANQVFSRTLRWLRTFGGAATVTLAHGKARRVEEYARLLSGEIGIDECGTTLTASQWLAGAKKALLSPVVVGTVDQLLFAGVSARHVALRHFGLAGKVVVVDEVHAYDAYMSRILHRVLEWLGAAGVPVVLLSATLAAKQRTELLAAYARHPVEEPSVDGAGYPRLTWIAADNSVVERPADLPAWITLDTARVPTVATPAADPRRKATVAVEVLSEPDETVVPDLVVELLREGGAALVLRNTVTRAQRTFSLLRDRLGADAVTLAHARFTVADRRAREADLVTNFGPGATRPSPHVVVATQVVEQSLDVDFDVLVTDLAPIDLLLQRIGRMHRHHRGEFDRPAGLRTPRMFVVGQEQRSDGPLLVPLGSRLVYGEHLLWRTAAVLRDRPTIEIPADVPILVDTVYGSEPVGAPAWRDALEGAARRAREKLDEEIATAESVLLGPPDTHSLAEVQRHRGDVLEEASAEVQAVVRLGRPTTEVLLLRATDNPVVAESVSAGTPVQIPLDRVPPPELIDAALDQLIRLPPHLTNAAERESTFISEWRESPWLARSRVLRLPADGSALRLEQSSCSYFPDRGLEIARA